MLTRIVPAFFLCLVLSTSCLAQQTGLWEAPEIVSPVNGTHISNSIALRWSAVPNARTYQVQLWIEGLTLWRDSVLADTKIVFKGFLPAEYFVIVRALNDGDSTSWSSTEFSFTADLIGVAEHTEQPVTLYPNPAKDVIHLDRDKAYGAIEVRDILGTERLSSTMSGTSQDIDVSDLPNGTYFLRLSSGGEVRTLRFTIAR